jgi:hypothetical protein
MAKAGPSGRGRPSRPGPNSLGGPRDGNGGSRMTALTIVVIAFWGWLVWLSLDCKRP